MGSWPSSLFFWGKGVNCSFLFCPRFVSNLEAICLRALSGLKTIWAAVATICVASSCFRSKMEDLEMYSDNLLFNKRQLGPIGQYTV